MNKSLSDSGSYPGTTLLTAIMVVVGGTAWADPPRLRLLLIPASFLITAWAAGKLVNCGLRGGFPTQVTRPLLVDLAVHIGVGIACLSLLFVLSALSGILWLAGIAALPLLALGLLEIIQVRFPIRFSRQFLMEVTGGLGIGAAWLVAWLWATIPPTFFDELAYHLVIPQRALATGALQATPWVFFTLMPHASDLLLAWGMAFTGDLGARATLFAIWVACSLAAWALAEVIVWPRTNSWTASLTAGMLASSPTLWFLATLPFSETCLVVAVLTAAAVTIVPWGEHRPWLPLGLALGLAATVKLSGLIWVMAGLAMAVVIGWRRSEITLAALLAFLSLLPWWARSMVYTGNPIYPMAYGILGGEPWSLESQVRVKNDLAPGLSDIGFWGLLRLPLDLVQRPEQFGSASDAGIVAITAVCLVLVMPVVVRAVSYQTRWRRLADAGAVFMLLSGIGWVLTSTTTRFFAPGLVIGLVALTGGVLHFDNRMRALVILGVLMAGVWGTWRFIEQHDAAFSSYNIALGRERSEKYLARRLDHFLAAKFVREKLPIDVKLLFIGETRPYYFSRESIAPSAYDRHPLHQWVLESSSPEALAKRLAFEGMTHVVLNVREFKRLHDSYGVLAFSGEGAEANDRVLKHLPQVLRPLFASNGVYIFEVPRRAAAEVGRSAS